MLGKKRLQIESSPLCDGFLILAPLSGESLAIETSGVSTISNRLLGDGVTLVPSGTVIVAPFDGVIQSISSTGTSWVFKAKNGVVLLLTLADPERQLAGDVLILHTKVGDKIQAGQRIAELKLPEFLEVTNNVALSFPLLGTNTQVYHRFQKFIAGKDPMFSVKVE